MHSEQPKFRSGGQHTKFFCASCDYEAIAAMYLFNIISAQIIHSMINKIVFQMRIIMKNLYNVFLKYKRKFIVRPAQKVKPATSVQCTLTPAV